MTFAANVIVTQNLYSDNNKFGESNIGQEPTCFRKTKNVLNMPPGLMQSGRITNPVDDDTEEYLEAASSASQSTKAESS